ncbi:MULTISPECIES: hypothetical protein [Paraburkholderia]|uniref:hypothetical protein n=1 Tax=Paraburkholderia TaxID=1822464 RepID=UPI003218D09F
MAELSDVTPVLICRTESSVDDHIDKNGNPSNVIVGYFAEIYVMLIHFQFGDLQVCWTGDLKFQTIWETVEKWEQEGRVPIAFYVGDEKHVSNAVCVEMSSNPVLMPLTWAKGDPDESDAAGQFVISDMPLAS